MKGTATKRALRVLSVGALSTTLAGCAMLGGRQEAQPMQCASLSLYDWHASNPEVAGLQSRTEVGKTYEFFYRDLDDSLVHMQWNETHGATERRLDVPADLHAAGVVLTAPEAGHAPYLLALRNEQQNGLAFWAWDGNNAEELHPLELVEPFDRRWLVTTLAHQNMVVIQVSGETTSAAVDMTQLAPESASLPLSERARQLPGERLWTAVPLDLGDQGLWAHEDFGSIEGWTQWFDSQGTLLNPESEEQIPGFSTALFPRVSYHRGHPLILDGASEVPSQGFAPELYVPVGSEAFLQRTHQGQTWHFELIETHCGPAAAATRTQP